MKFNTILMNPPYQAPSNKKRKGGRGSRNTIWEKFIEVAIDLLKDDGFLASINPPRWRKPEDKTGEAIYKQNLLYLEIHNAVDGKKTFDCGTRYDWYILRKNKPLGKTVIKCEDETITTIDTKKWKFIPNSNFELIKPIMASRRDKGVLYSRSSYGRDKKWMSETRTKIHTIKCVHSILKGGIIRYMYSSKNNGMIETPKVIVSENGTIHDVVIDHEGKLGFTSGCFALPISNKEEGENIASALKVEKFLKIIASTKWSSFRIEYQMFKYFRQDWWREFV